MNGYLSNESGYLFNDNNEMLDSLSQAINDYRLDSNKIKSKLFNIEEVVKKIKCCVNISTNRKGIQL